MKKIIINLLKKIRVGKEGQPKVSFFGISDHNMRMMAMMERRRIKRRKRIC